jgi:predicted enzyme related to lactoylglutathione lyase
VKGIDSFVEKIAAHGGEIVEHPRPDEPGGNCYIATFHDPAGNTLRIYEEPGS